MKELIGKEVRIYPGDTRSKQGIIVEMNADGVLFKITESDCSDYSVGKLHFISYAARLNFEEI